MNEPAVTQIKDKQLPVAPSAEGGDPVKFLGHVLGKAVNVRASDIHMRVKNHPMFRVDGTLRSMREYPILSVQDMEDLSRKLMKPRHWEIFQRDYQVDISIGIQNIGRVRVNIYYQRGTIAMALRVIHSKIPTPEELHLPAAVRDFVRFERCDGLREIYHNCLVDQRDQL